jgi:RNA polymerase sigma factor (sigma-70 family)
MLLDWGNLLDPTREFIRICASIYEHTEIRSNVTKKISNCTIFWCLTVLALYWLGRRFMAKTQRLVFSERYTSAVDQLKSRLWQRYSKISDPADRDNVIALTLSRIADHEEKLGPAKNLPALIWRIFPEVVANLLRGGYHRVQSFTVVDSETELHGIALDPTSEIEDRIFARKLLDVLDERSRQVVYRHIVQGQSASQIAADLKTSAGNVRVILHRALEQLRRVR